MGKKMFLTWTIKINGLNIQKRGTTFIYLIVRPDGLEIKHKFKITRLRLESRTLFQDIGNRNKPDIN